MIKHFSSVSKLGSVPAPSVNFDGTWKNQLKSEMAIKVDGGKVTGRYRAGVGTPRAAEEFDLVGFASGDQISFTVNFGKYGTLTSWVGQLTTEAGTEIIKTMWILSENVPDPEEPKKLWGSVLTGSANFVR